MKMKAVIAILGLMLMFHLAAAQQIDSAGMGPNKVVVATSPSTVGQNPATSADSARYEYYRTHPEAQTISPVFRYQNTSSGQPPVKRELLSNDTIITPTMRYYPPRKEK